MEMWYILIDEKFVDVLMKPLGRGKFMYFRDKIKVMENISLSKRES